MKNIFKKSMPLLAALAVTTTALPLSLASTTTVSAEESIKQPEARETEYFLRRPEAGETEYFVKHWVETKSVTPKQLDYREAIQDGNRYFVLVATETKIDKKGKTTDEKALTGVHQVGNKTVDFGIYNPNSVEINNIVNLGASEFVTDVHIYYYLK